ncbi:hypothetical protein BJ165DRAFT_1545314 [Panaeolus papilionaceus]|nr:hypothetical protein BJ165DRAFT_1545314 [Panaeolus papilionaceus]
MDEGPEEAERKRRLEMIQKLANYDRLGEWSEDEFMDEGEYRQDEEDLDNVLTELLDGIAAEREQSSVHTHQPSDADPTWFPYQSKLMFLLDAIDNLPRMRISGSVFKVIMWLLENLGVRGVPSFNAFRKMQNEIRERVGVSTINSTTPKGNHFSYNDPCAIIANDWSNPLVRPYRHRYPVISKKGIVSEIWHGDKWTKEINRHFLSPMYDAGDESHFYIDEPAQMKDGQLVIPLRWWQDEGGKVWADAWDIVLNTDGTSTICDNERSILISAQELDKCMVQLEDENRLPVWSSATIAAGYPSLMPNPDRLRAGGDPLYTSFIDIFGDDVSGNKSKSWNKHENIYIAHRNLPRKHLHQQTHVHFVSCSPHATFVDQFAQIKSRIESTHEAPIKFRDPVTGVQTRFRIFCMCEPGDNPAQSQASGHIGGNGNHPCRKCMVGGTQKDKESDTGFHALFSTAAARSAEQTLEAVQTQINLACLGVASKVKEKQTENGVKDSFSQSVIEDLIAHFPQRPPESIQVELMKWVKDHQAQVSNPFLTLKGFNAATDTPVEILHTILLGIVKYGWHGARRAWNTSQEQTYMQRLQATNTGGLSIHPIRSKYIMQYANSLNGRQLKTLAQVNAFHIYDLSDNLHFLLTKAIGEISALLWFPEIRNMEQYLEDVDTAAANVLDIAALIDPTKIVAKIKYHLLLHLHDDIRRFGPLVGVATEVFESFNTIFRFCSIYSNHLAPSQDIANQLARQETFKHIALGGWWAMKDGDWACAGPSLRKFMMHDKVLTSLIGWTEISRTVKLVPETRDLDGKLQKRKPDSWSSTIASTALNAAALFAENASPMWFQAKHVVAESQDICTHGSWIFARSPTSITGLEASTAHNQGSQTHIITGQVVEIIQDTSSKRALVTIDEFHVLDTRHIKFGMPVLSRRLGTKELIVVDSKALLFEYNTQHDCDHSKCSASGRKAVVQERIETGSTDRCIQHNHTNLEKYIVNTHAFHNAHLLRDVLPRDLTKPVPYASDRRSFHDNIAQQLRETRNSKRLASNLKKRKRRNGAEDVAGSAGSDGEDSGADVV